MVSTTAKLVIILGSPASGKSTLARRLGTDLDLGVLGKDDVKEALFDALGSEDRGFTRRLSEASFTVLARLARTQLLLGHSCIVEGNWRSSHAPSLGAILDESGARAAQVCCCAQPSEIVRRFTTRVRHAGHRDASLSSDELEAYAREAPAFIDVPGPRWVFHTDSDESAEAYCELRTALESWRL